VSRRPYLEWAVLVALLWLLGGVTGLAVAAAFVVYDLVRAPAPRDLLVVAVLCLALVPLVVLARGLPQPATVGPGFVTGNLLAHHLAGAGLALLVVGVLREVRAGRDQGDEEEAPAEPPRELPPQPRRQLPPGSAP
jgi:hypothetical protein